MDNCAEINSGIWTDKRFTNLDRCTQMLYLFLLTNGRLGIAGWYYIDATEVTKNVSLAWDTFSLLIQSGLVSIEKCGEVLTVAILDRSHYRIMD